MVAIHELTRDERIQLAILEALDSHPGIGASAIGVEVEDAAVTLTGTVASVKEGVDAESAAWGVPGVRDVDNEIEVRGLAPPSADVTGVELTRAMDS